MPTPQPPLLLYDNVFNRVRQYPTALLSATSTAPGADVRVVSAGRRERAYWRANVVAPLEGLYTDLGAGAAKSVSALWIDRGHNLWGKTVRVTAYNDAYAVIDTRNLTVPAQGTVGGDPTSGTMAVTEEGALYALVAATAPAREYFVGVVEAWQPIIPGLLLGTSVQLPIFSTTMDEDAGKLAGLVREESQTGLLATSRGYDYRTLTLTYARIGSSTYDTITRQMRELLFAKRQLCFIAPNYGSYPARGWLYRHDSDTWSAPTSGVLRRVALPFREVGALIR